MLPDMATQRARCPGCDTPQPKTADRCSNCGVGGDSHGGQRHQRRPSAQALALAPRRTAPKPAQVPKLWIDAKGWLQGSNVKHEPLPSNLQRTNAWRVGHPVGALDHFTDGCHDPYGTLVDRGVSAHGVTMQDGQLIQFISFRNSSFHAYDMAYYYVGWENAAAPGAGCDFNVPMLSRLFQMNAVLLDWIETTYKVTIPTTRSPGGPPKPGIKGHADGLAPGANWDPKRHWDAVWKATGDPIARWVSAGERAALDRSPWTSAQCMVVIESFRTGGPDVALTDQQLEDLDWLHKFRTGYRVYQDAGKAPRKGTTQREGYNAAKAAAQAGK